MEKNISIHRADIDVKILIHENKVMFNIYWVYILNKRYCKFATHVPFTACGWAKVKKNLLQLPIVRYGRIFCLDPW
jgi:hypothetical protein